MPDVINREDAIRIIEDIKEDRSIPKNYGTLLDILRGIRRLPAVDQVRQAHWVNVTNKAFEKIESEFVCSKCLYKLTFAEPLKKPSEYGKYNYCACCGAKMDEEV